MYAAVCKPGPVTVNVDLGREVSVIDLEMTKYSPALAFSDFAWDVSRDGKNCITVFDSQSPANSNRQIVDNVTSRFGLADKGCFRFLRLTFRSGMDQNRLLLRRIVVYKK